MTEFVPFPKVYRLFREVTITEKIDGTNSGIQIAKVRPEVYYPGGISIWLDDSRYLLTPQSRNRVLTVDSDNFGFAKWVHDNALALVEDLGEGVHFGEWWGLGIQRGYDQDTKHFSLFNTTRWAGSEFVTPDLRITPVLYQGNFSESTVRLCLDALRERGSFAAPGFDRPEGVVTYFKFSNTMYKTTIEGDDANKFELEKK